VNAPAQILKDSHASPAERLWVLAADDMASVDALILDRMQSPVGLIPNLAQHLVGAGGKRLSELRRGKKPANLIWGNSASILVGDFLFARAFNLMVETGSMEALGILSNASSIIAEGEVQQLAALRDVKMGEEAYMQVISAKTAALFAAATEVAPVIAGRPTKERDALRDYGLKLGLAFQLVDDALDYGGFESALGKSVGDDFREGKMTLPVIRAVEAADKTEAEFWHRVIVEREQTEVDFETAISLLRKTGALDSTMDIRF